MAGLGLNHILEIAKRGLFAQRLGIDITGHNVANATRPGYSRQRADLRSGEVLKSSQGLLGTGVLSTNGGRLRNAFIDEQVRNSYGSFEDASTQRSVLSRIETKINELTTNGIGQQLTRFFNSFQTLSQQPEDLQPRINVVNQAKRLTDTFHTTFQAYQSAQKETIDQLGIVLNQVNELGKAISQLDVEVLRLQSSGSDASDTKDQRDILIDELSKLANVKVSEDSRGSVIVSLGGTVIASRAGSLTLSTAFVTKETTFEGSDVAVPQLVIVGPPFNEDSAEDPRLRLVNVTSGQLNGYLNVYNNLLTPGLIRLNTMANVLTEKVNEIHENGAGRYNPETGSAESGLSFFNPDVINTDDLVLGNSASLIAIADEIYQDPNNVAGTEDEGLPGNNVIAKQLAALLDERMFLTVDEPTLTISEYNNLTTDEIATASFQAANLQEASESVLQQMQFQQQAVSGVSTDEEMANLINFQRAYDASAKVASTVNDMFLTILNMV